MKRALIVQKLCQSCAACKVQEFCTRGAILREEPTDRPWVDFYQCSGCMKCKPVCPNGAVDEISQPCTGQRRMSW